MLKLVDIGFEVPQGKGASKEILRDVCLEVDADSLVVITGPNGGGKSTLAKIIMGIEKPSHGSIFLEGEDITHLDVTQRARMGIGFAFQQPVRFKGLTVRDLLSLAAGKRLNTEKACAYLGNVGLCAKDYVDRELDASLSGGELKRIEIAMVSARQPRLAVFDEPEAGIDLWSFHNLIRVFEDMRRNTKGAIIIISHQERILETADRIVVVADGRITGQGDKAEMLPQLLNDSDSCDLYRRAADA